MADGDLAQRNNIGDDITNFGNLLSLFKDKNTTSDSNSNTTELVSPEKATALLQQMLGGISGLAQVSSGQKAAGGYDSTTNMLLTNDLLSRTAGDVASRSSIKVSSATADQSVKAVLSGQGGSALGALGALQSGVKGYNALGTLLGSGSAGALGSAGSAAGATAAASEAGASIEGLGTAGSLSSILGGGSSAAEGLGSIGAASAAGAGSAAAIGEGAALAEGATAAEGIGAAVEGGSMLEELGTAAVAVWIICTELHKQKKLPTKYYIHGARAFLSYSECERQGYYVWAIPSVIHLRKHPDSFYSKLLEKFFVARAEHIAALAGIRGAKSSKLMAITEYIGKRVCRLMGKCCKHRDFNVVYSGEYNG